METKSVSKIYTLNKITYINLRWIAILGQFFTVNIVKYIFNFEFDILTINIVIVLGVISNLFLAYFYQKNLKKYYQRKNQNLIFKDLRVLVK